MKFATWLRDGAEEAGILSTDMETVHSFERAGLIYANMLDFIARRSEADMAALSELAGKPGRPLAQVRLLAPIPRPHHDVICLGLNYMDHVLESGSYDIDADPVRDEAVYFAKHAVRPIGQGGEIDPHTAFMEQLDYEAELALVIGKTASGVKEADAWDYVFGLTCFNDISGRELQSRHQQWFLGKSLDTFTAFGPWIATLDEFQLPLALDICSRVNGEVRQSSNTAKMIFTPPYVIAELSAGLTLDPGTIIATGTPAGVGVGFTPHRCMKPGDVVEVEIEGIGTLRNVVGRG